MQLQESVRHTQKVADENSVEQIVRSISLEIFDGHYKLGAKIAPIRQLAEHYGVTVATIQRAIARLEGLGLVKARHGSGTRVSERLNIASAPLWFATHIRDPESAPAMLDDFLDLFVAIAVPLYIQVRHILRAAHGQEFLDHILELERRMEARAHSVDEVVETLAALQHLYATYAKRRSYGALIALFEQFFLKDPQLRFALYGEPGLCLYRQRYVRELLQSDITDDAVQRQLSHWAKEQVLDVSTRFRRAIVRPPTVATH